MEETIRSEICRFIRENPANRSSGDGAYFEEPLVAFSSAEDPLFSQLKTVIGPLHLTPAEFLSGARSVISWILPITRPTRISNRREDRWPSRQWAHTRSYGEALNVSLRRHLCQWLEGLGYRSVAPQLSPAWREYADTPAGIASTWSERHAAYAAGLGTFSLNDALITTAGIAHRCGSVVTDLLLAPSPRPFRDHRENCLFFREGTCGLCISRCPVGALSHKGHDKDLCRQYVYGAAPAMVGEEYGVPHTGCGLCQTRVPCEAMIPPGGRSRGKNKGG